MFSEHLLAFISFFMDLLDDLATNQLILLLAMLYLEWLFQV